jgi:hypothetical protein
MVHLGEGKPRAAAKTVVKLGAADRLERMRAIFK